MNIVIHFYSYIYIHMNKNTILSLFILSNFFKAIPRGLKDFSYQTRDGTCAPCHGSRVLTIGSSENFWEQQCLKKNTEHMFFAEILENIEKHKNEKKLLRI